MLLHEHDTMMQPPVEGLLDRTQSKFRLVTLSAKRARQINSYYGQLGDTHGALIPPQVTSTARKALSIAFAEIAADKIVPGEPTDEVDSADGEPGSTPDDVA